MPPTPLLEAHERALIEEEEQRAWDIGRQELAALGHVSWGAFDVAEQVARTEYAKILDGGTAAHLESAPAPAKRPRKKLKFKPVKR